MHFTGPSEFEDPSGAWNWIGRTEGNPTARTQQWVTGESSPVEPGHALRLSVTAPGGATAMNGFDADDASSGKSARCNVADQRIFIDVRVDQPSANAWLELRLHLSYYPDLPGYSRGYRSLTYRFGTQTGRSRDPSNPLRGIVSRAVPSGTWTTLELRPVEDIAAIFTELPVPADNATTAKSASENIVMTVAAVARNGATAAGWFDRLRFVHDDAGQATYDLQRQLLQQYGPLFPTVQARAGDEISRNGPHLNWLTGTPAPISYNLNTWPAQAEVRRVIDAVHAAGAVLQYNHPFGAEAGGSFTDQTALLTQARNLLMNSGAWPVLDLLETGYQRRGTGTNMASIETHLRLFDLMARAGRFVTATGVTDDHEGLVNSWSSRTNRFATGIWSSSLADGNVRNALLAGQAWCMEVQPSGTVDRLDITVDGIVPMGSVSVQQRATRMVQVVCPVIPSGGRAELVRGPVDYVSSDLTNRTTGFATATEAQLESGTVSREVDTSSDCFVRVQIRSAGGEIVAFSNPIWLLRSTPPGGIPALRRAPDVQSADRRATWHALPSCHLPSPAVGDDGRGTWEPEVEELRRREAHGAADGRADKVERQHAGASSPCASASTPCSTRARSTRSARSPGGPPTRTAS